jgi:signal transduction histidine kinase
MSNLHDWLVPSGLTPHGFCLLWEPWLIWTHTISDAAIALSYFSIPFVLVQIARQRHDLVFKPVFWMFAAFILLCGTGHWFDLVILWVPAYGAQTVIKISTAVASVLTAAVLWPLLPRVLALPSPMQMRQANEALENLVEERGLTIAALNQSQAALKGMNETLEARVNERTATLSQTVDALRAEKLERERAEAALRQSQKMEAIGQLTGGIAHDFNNMLQAISGNLELLRRDFVEASQVQATRLADAALRSVARAADITNRLLAFARRQILQPREVQANDLISGMSQLVICSMGPAISVELDLMLNAPTVRCDPHQLESAILNLAINARDAMWDNGKLVISTRETHLRDVDIVGHTNAIPGRYIEISLVDNGKGMDEVTLSRAFEPFFTTKPLGQGTGLGLSQVYGFIQQSDGLIQINSLRRKGTTVRLYLPLFAALEAELERPAPPVTPREVSAGASILLVEDEPSVREVTAEQLRVLGYQVLEAEDGPSALRQLGGQERIDILISDVGLPGGLNGRQVADAARESRPGLPVLLVTGYAGSALDSLLAPGMEVMGKPFAMQALAAKVRAMIRLDHREVAAEGAHARI